MRKFAFILLMILITVCAAQAQEAKLVQENYDSLRVKEIRIEVADSAGEYIKQGEFVRWYEDGSRWMDGRYENGFIENKVTEYRKDLTRNAIKDYYKGNEASQVLFGPRGFIRKDIADTSTTSTRIDKITAPNGQYVQREGYDGKKKIFINHGKATVWTKEGGLLYEEGIFKNGKLHGLVVRYYPDGKKEFEGTYNDGKQDGVWLYWDKMGKLEKFVVYENDKIKTELKP
jgi:antitoxin component YwqK of YwqJK toxin-antitoxin module